MSKYRLVIHGGASQETTFLKNNLERYEEGLREALIIGEKILRKGGSAIKCVEAVVCQLEDNTLFNAGRGSALNSAGEVEMDASLMDGKNLRVGAVSMVRKVKNPISLAKIIMTKTKHVFLSGYGALQLAEFYKMKLEPEAYFLTDHQLEYFYKFMNAKLHKKIQQKKYGTVGAVAMDKNGNLAAATSTGGTDHCLPGRIGDSCVIGAGCYANNKTCAISGTGEGEALIRGVVAHTISMLIELKKMPLDKACRYVINQRNRLINGEIGVIGINAKGEIATHFNTKIMKRAWLGSDIEMKIKIY